MTDTDTFTFQIGSSGGNATLTIDRIEYLGGAMLDVLATLKNSSGTAIATSNPTAVRSASISQTLTAGSYSLVIQGGNEGTAANGFTAYSSIGYYGIEGTITGAVTTGTGGSTGAGGSSTGGAATGGVATGGSRTGGTATGGTATGGKATGGSPTGGSATAGKATGGATGTTGGTLSTGGNLSTGGTSTSGGNPATGGTTSTGGSGASATGGSGDDPVPNPETDCNCRTAASHTGAGRFLGLLGLVALGFRRRRPRR
jgi:MYXO-CTERM domain-containing protein